MHVAVLVLIGLLCRTSYGQSSISDIMESPSPTLEPPAFDNDYLRETGPIILLIVGGFVFALLWLIFIMYFVCLCLGVRRKKRKQQRREKYKKTSSGGTRNVNKAELEYAELGAIQDEFALPGEESLTRTFSAENPSEHVTTFQSSSTIGKPTAVVSSRSVVPPPAVDEEEDSSEEESSSEEEEEDGGEGRGGESSEEESSEEESSEEESSSEDDADETLDELQKSMEDLSRSLDI